MTKSQLITLVDKLEGISGKLVQAGDAKSLIDTKLLAHNANQELLEVIQVLINHGMRMEES